MALSLDECKAKYPSEELFVIKDSGVDFVCRYPTPDAYDEVIPGQLSAKATGDFGKFYASLEDLTKHCVVSHTPEELDGLRKSRRMYGLFRDVGGALFARVELEDNARGKDSAGASTDSSKTPAPSAAG